MLEEYRVVLRMIVDAMWLTPLEWNKLFIDNDFLQQFIGHTWLNQRAIQCCAKQALAMVKAATKKRHKQLYVLEKLQQEPPVCYLNRKHNPLRRLQRKIDKVPLVKPYVSNTLPITLDSRFVNFRRTEGEFGYFVQIKGLGNKTAINLPLKETKVSRRWYRLGKLHGSIRLDEQQMYLMFDVMETPKNDTGITVGADQGQTTTLTLSDGQVTGVDCHEHNLKSICDHLGRCCSGSVGTRRAQAHRAQYINWSLKQLDYQNIKEVRLERLQDVRRGRNTSASLRHWTYTLIKQKLTSLAQEEGFKLVEVPNEFRSQRCSCCGWVRKANRQRKAFRCKSCGFTTDADLNASCNLELELANLTEWITLDGRSTTLALAIRRHRLNLKGFYWTETGVWSPISEVQAILERLINVGQEPVVGTNIPAASVVPDTLKS